MRGGVSLLKKKTGAAGQKRHGALFCLTLSVLMLFIPFSNIIAVQAATYSFTAPNIKLYKPINFQNGDFETPVLAGQYGQFNMSAVPGWYTYPSDGVLNSGWDMIEFQKPGYTYGFVHSTVNGSSQYVEANANMRGRLNQTVDTTPGSVVYWQFAHAARAENSDTSRTTTTGYDTMNFYLRKGGNHGSVAPVSSEIMTTAATDIHGMHIGGTIGTIGLRNATVEERANGTDWAYYRGKFTIPSDYLTTEFGWQSNSAIWDTSAGNYLDDVRFVTESRLIVEKSITDSAGNRIDGAYGKYSDIITIRTKVTNWGEADAAPCVLTDMLWNGLTFVDGSVSGDSGITGTVSYDASTQKVTANIGEGATSSAGGTIKGSQAQGTSGTTGKGQQAIVTIHAKITGTPGSTVKNQATVTYNDKHYENYNSSGKTAYSLIDYNIADANQLGTSTQGYAMNILNANGTIAATYRNVNTSAENSYVNQFTIVDRRADGTVWNDLNENGMIDSGEKIFSGTTVKLQVTADGGTTWTDATDWSGAPLTVVTGSDGKYEFKGVRSGQFRVLAAVSSNQAVSAADRIVNKKSTSLPAEVTAASGTQGSVDNDASPGLITNSGVTWAAVQTLSKTGSTFTPSASTYYTHNVDFGIVATAQLKKTAVAVGTGAEATGTSSAPADVLYGDSIRYTIVLSNMGSGSTGSPYGTISGTGSSLDIVAGTSVADTLPAGTAYVSSTVGGAAATPEISGQTLTFRNLQSISQGGTLTITVTARVISPNISLVNTAAFTDLDGTQNVSNGTYQHSKGLVLKITKAVKGGAADLRKSFSFYINPGYGQSGTPALNGLSALVSPYGIHDDLNNADVSAGTTAAYGSNTSISLKNGQSITIRDLPVNLVYVIQETDNTDYAVSVSIDNKTVNGGTANTGAYYPQYGNVRAVLNYNDAEVHYTNTKNRAVPTGIILEIWPYILAVLIVSGIGAGLIVLRVRGKKDRDRYGKRSHADSNNDNEGL